ESLSGEGEALDEYLQLLAEQTGGDVDGIRKALTSSGRMLEVKADIRKQAALEWVFERASIVDEEGNEVDRALLEPPEPVDEPEMAIPAADDEVGETSDPTPDGDEEE
ncbi:MAG TPA: hypothetical protein QF651_03920, partial [Acidimicrobiales bacterium]|nr:hypothetical protein [Acidimicrobiales bacterium]